MVVMLDWRQWIAKKQRREEEEEKEKEEEEQEKEKEEEEEEVLPYLSFPEPLVPEEHWLI